MNKRGIKQLKNFERELFSGPLYLSGKEYYNHNGKKVSFPSNAVMNDIGRRLNVRKKL